LREIPEAVGKEDKIMLPIKLLVLAGLFPQLQQPLEATGIPLWIWGVGAFLVILVGVIWTLYEEEGGE
jgi:hypothetical protein